MTVDIGGPLLLVGCGKMGSALLSAWLDQGVPAEQIRVVEPHAPSAEAARGRGVVHLSYLDEIDPEFSPTVVVLAVKPQQKDAIMPGCRRFARPETVFLSIAAGKTVAYFEQWLGPEAVIVRAMPNTPAAAGRGMTVLFANPKVSDAQRRVCGELLEAVGEAAWIEDEALMDAVTAVSGGGPAYVFLMIEVLARAGVESGLPEDLAMRLARVTVAGAGELVYQSDQPASVLRENVTSPGGTTLEALKILMLPDGFQALMNRAIAAATQRSRELAS